MVDALVRQKLIAGSEMQFEVTAKGWRWFGVLGIECDMMKNNRRPVARQCLDWTERRPHLAGQLGALMLQKMLEEKWFKRVKFSRELLITAKGSKEMYDRLKIKV